VSGSWDTVCSPGLPHTEEQIISPITAPLVKIAAATPARSTFAAVSGEALARTSTIRPAIPASEAGLASGTETRSPSTPAAGVDAAIASVTQGTVRRSGESTVSDASPGRLMYASCIRIFAFAPIARSCPST
jgi:hypothetical protein